MLVDLTITIIINVVITDLRRTGIYSGIVVIAISIFGPTIAIGIGQNTFAILTDIGIATIFVALTFKMLMSDTRLTTSTHKPQQTHNPKYLPSHTTNKTNLNH
jgi:hypothetical protein